MTRPIRYPLPADAEPGALALRACEAALDQMALAETLADPALWENAADQFVEAAYYCREAAARLHRAARAQREAEGMAQCAQCGRWRPTEALFLEPLGVERGLGRANHRRVCAGGCEPGSEEA